jgi:diadenosine tetraphosphate (Ap4A) HIT family hydrolase
MSDDCVFCSAGSTREIIASSALSLAFFDGFPVSPGHVLVIPRRHVASFFDLTEEEVADMMALMHQVKSLIDARFHPDGYNIGCNCGEAAGQTINHFHLHIIPRYKGDCENPRGGVRGVIPSHMSY